MYEMTFKGGKTELIKTKKGVENAAGKIAQSDELVIIKWHDNHNWMEAFCDGIVAVAKLIEDKN